MQTDHTSSSYLLNHHSCIIGPVWARGITAKRERGAALNALAGARRGARASGHRRSPTVDVLPSLSRNSTDEPSHEHATPSKCTVAAAQSRTRGRASHHASSHAHPFLTAIMLPEKAGIVPSKSPPESPRPRSSWRCGPRFCYTTVGVQVGGLLWRKGAKLECRQALKVLGSLWRS